MLLSAFTNWLAFAATLLVSFFLSPYLIHKLKDGPYGVWVYAESILSYFTLFDLGIAACLVRFVAKFHTNGSWDELNRMASSCLVLFMGLGFAVLLLGAALTPVLVPPMLKSGLPRAEITWVLLLMLGNLAITLPLSLFPAMLDGLERFAAKSLIRIIFLAIKTIGSIVLMENQPTLLGLCILHTICNLAENVALVLLTFAYLPGLRLSRYSVDRATFRIVGGYSFSAFLIMLSGRVCVQSAAIVIGLFLDTPAITWFAISLRLVEYAKSFLRSATITLTPAISSMEAAGDWSGVRRMFRNATRWVLYLILPVQLGLVLFGKSFIQIWMGSTDYAERCYPSLVILSTTLSLVLAQSIAAQDSLRDGPLALVCPDFTARSSGEPRLEPFAGSQLWGRRRGFGSSNSKRYFMPLHHCRRLSITQDQALSLCHVLVGQTSHCINDTGVDMGSRSLAHRRLVRFGLGHNGRVSAVRDRGISPRRSLAQAGSLCPACYPSNPASLAQ